MAPANPSCWAIPTLEQSELTPNASRKINCRSFKKKKYIYIYTPPKFNSSPLNPWWLEDDPFLLGLGNFQGRTVKLREGKCLFWGGCFLEKEDEYYTITDLNMISKYSLILKDLKRKKMNWSWYCITWTILVVETSSLVQDFLESTVSIVTLLLVQCNPSFLSDQFGKIEVSTR